MTTASRINTGYNDWFSVPGRLPNAPDGFNWVPGPRGLYDPGEPQRLKSGEFIVTLPTDPSTYPDRPASRVRTFFEDYYNRIYIEPAQIDYGAISGDSTVSVQVWNAFYAQPVTLTQIQYAEVAGLRVEGELLPLTLPPLGLAQYQVTALAQGPAQLNEVILWEFDLPWSFDMPVSGNRAKAWVFEPNWPPTGKTYQVSYTFKTEIITSHSGKEQRVALRSSPRKVLEHQVLLTHDTLRQYKDLTRHSQHRAAMLPEITRFTLSAAEQEIGSPDMVLEDVPPWVLPGATLWVTHLGHVEIRVVESITDNVVRFQSVANSVWPVGTKIHPALTGYLATELAAPRATNAVARLALRFEVAPVSEPVTALPAADTVFNGREVFLKRVNWANQVTVKAGHDVVDLDYDRGPVSRFTPILFGYETHQAVYVNRNAQEAEDVLNFFRRMRGQQGEFYMPTWEYDFVPAGVISAQSTGMLIADADFASNYKDSTVYRAVFVKMNDGELILRKVTQIEQVENGSVILVDEPWGREFTADDIVMCGWMPVWRLASDTLTIEWLTNSVAQFTLNMITLEDLPVETA